LKRLSGSFIFIFLLDWTGLALLALLLWLAGWLAGWLAAY